MPPNIAALCHVVNHYHCRRYHCFRTLSGQELFRGRVLVGQRAEHLEAMDTRARA